MYRWQQFLETFAACWISHVSERVVVAETAAAQLKVTVVSVHEAAHFDGAVIVVQTAAAAYQQMVCLLATFVCYLLVVFAYAIAQTQSEVAVAIFVAEVHSGASIPAAATIFHVLLAAFLIPIDFAPLASVVVVVLSRS